MAVTTLNVISLDSALSYLNADAFKIEQLLVKGLIDCEMVDGDYVVNEDQFNCLNSLIERNHLRLNGGENITVYELQNFCLSRGYVSSEKEFDRYLGNNLFSDFKQVHPFNNSVTYKGIIFQCIINAVKRGGIITLKHGGYTGAYIIKSLGITNQKFKDLTTKLNVKPKFFEGFPIYTQDQYLSIKSLNRMIKSVSHCKNHKDENDAVFVYKGDEYIKKDNVRLYIRTKYSTVAYLNNIGAIKYRDIVFEGNVITVALKDDLDSLKSYLEKGYKPAVISLALSGFLTEEEFNSYVFTHQFMELMDLLKISERKAKFIVESIYPADIVIQGVKMYRKRTLNNFITKYFRGTYTLGNLSKDFISTEKLGGLIGKSAKNVRSYAYKYLDPENDIVRQGSTIFIRLSSYVKLQGSLDVELKLNEKEEQVKNKLNFEL